MLCIWQDTKGPVYLELIPPENTITSKVYSDQLLHLDQNILEKHLSVSESERCQPECFFAEGIKKLPERWERR